MPRGEVRFWASDHEGNIYLFVHRDGGTVVYGPLSKRIAHLPELLLLSYAAVMFVSVWLGVASLSVLLMLVYGIAWVPLLVVPRVVLERMGAGRPARLIKLNHFSSDVYRLSVWVHGLGDTVLYVRGRRTLGKVRAIVSTGS